MANLPTEIIKIARPIHWIKNLALFAALVFSGNLFVEIYFYKVFWAFIIFSLAASASYIFNDVLDAKSDRLHPIKKRRPVASGKLPVPIALVTALTFALVALYWSTTLGSLFSFLVLLYLVLQIAYSLGLKNIAIIDILIIAAGFIIRVYAGAFVIDAHLSVWFLLCVISVALFLASGKRRAELNILKFSSGVTRKSLSKYRRELLNSYVTMFGNAAWMSWALFTFFESPKASLSVWLLLAELSRTTTINKLLMITIPVAIFGIMRYESLIFEGRSEAPEKLLLTDKALVISVLLWLGLVVWILYGGLSVLS
ncbi:decaprenyl-phosphate phosphoribosyltransferase [Candidatus Woesebacteria bacterium]|nr:decaprenyl-phosphate phosphoribosyltransferase [Candidatus Woesebacteria bacterium]